MSSQAQLIPTIRHRREEDRIIQPQAKARRIRYHHLPVLNPVGSELSIPGVAVSSHTPQR